MRHEANRTQNKNKGYMKKVNLNPSNSKVINGTVFVTALKALASYVKKN